MKKAHFNSLDSRINHEILFCLEEVTPTGYASATPHNDPKNQNELVIEMKEQKDLEKCNSPREYKRYQLTSI